VKGDRLYLIHVTECIARIREYTVDGRDAFLSDRRTQDAVLRNLQVLAESTQRIAPEFRQIHPAVNWKLLSGFRNVLVHDYLGLNMVRVWEFIERALPDLERAFASMRDAGNAGKGGSGQ